MIKKALLILLLPAAASCASGPLLQVNLNARESYRSSDFKNVLDGEAVGLLTVAKENGHEYRKILGEIVEDALKVERPDIKVVPYWRTLSDINSEGLTKDYADMLNGYASTGILDRDDLKKLGLALRIKYFLMPRLVNFQQSQSTRFSALGLTLFKTHESDVKIYLELWDAGEGNIVWIGVGDATMADERLKAKPISFEQAVRAAVENLIKKMPKEENNREHGKNAFNH